MSRSPRGTRSPGSASGQRDHVAIAIAYAREAAADKRGKKFGKWVRLAARRFLDDLKRSKRKGAPFRFCAWHAADPCRFIEQLPHVEGRWETPNIVLHPAHVFATVNIFGFRNPDGTRRFSEALFAVARKNAKSTWAAGVLLYCECCEGEVGPQVVSAATTGAQARIVFGIARRMVERTPDLRIAFGVEPFANAIACLSNGGTFKPINAKASTQDGLNPSSASLDEVHAHKSHDLLNVLKSAAGARANPLFLFTTTEGYETPGPWPELRHFAQQVLEGVIEADHLFALIYAVDEDDEDFDDTKWIKANPLMDANPLLAREMAKLAIEARAMPGRLGEFRIKRLNRQASAARALIDIARWKRCDGAVDLDWLAQFPCWAAFDLSSTTDLTAWRLVWRVEGRWYTWGRRWVPADAVAHRTERGAHAYAGWVAAGLIEQTHGDTVDYAVIEAAIREDAERFRPTAIAFDDWNSRDLCNRLIADGLPLVKFIQGARSYHPAMQEVEQAYRKGYLAHSGDPVLRWCASNVVPRYDANLNMAPDKKRSPDKIDDMVALYMAVGVALAADDEGDMGDFLANPVIV